MKKTVKYIFALLFLWSITTNSWAQYPINNTCNDAIDVCSSDTVFYECCEGSVGCALGVDVWYKFCLAEALATGQTIQFKSAHGNVNYTLYGPNVSDCSQAIPANIYASASSSVPNPLVFNTLVAGQYYLRLHVDKCDGYIATRLTNFPEDDLCVKCDSIPCENCIGSFAPEPGKKYLISAWVREDNAPLDKTTFTFPRLYLNFPTASVTLGPFTANGQIIDGWQRLEQEFTIPMGATAIGIWLECVHNNCLFDDIRIIPFDGSMKSYVYDPVTLRLVAELDERNYATMYEYDEEGKLVRIKKETERGIMTIQENKTTVVKQ